MSASKSIIYLAPFKASFVIQDIDCLRKKIDVTPYFFLVKSKLFVPWQIVKLFFFLLISKKQDILVSFGGYHSFVAAFVAKLKGNKCFIILNGTDSTSIPEFSYGHLRGGLMRFCCKKSYEWCTQLLPVSDSLLKTTNNYAFDEPKRLGLLEEFYDLKTSYKIIPNGFDTNFWKPTLERIPNTFITVASANRLVHKGVDLIIELAKRKPDCLFFVAGVERIENAPTNVKALGYLNMEELRDAYSQSKFYIQLSIWEGFGCALCEAMLCECIPIVSNVNALPDIVGNPLMVLNKRSSKELDILFDEVKEVNSGNKYRQKIVLNYSIEKRIAQLVELIGTH